MTLPTISSFWTGAPLTFLEQVSLKSFADLGHRTRLYSYDPNLAVPDGVELSDAREIVPNNSNLGSYNGFAPFSDMFRINLLAKTNEVWVDCDVAAIKPMPDQAFIFALERRNYGNAVLRLPHNSKSLKWLLEFVNSEQPWLPLDWPWMRDLGELAASAEVQGERLVFKQKDIKSFPYMTYGPLAVSYSLLATGEVSNAMETNHFYPVHPVHMRRNYFRPRMARISLPEECIAVHHVGGNSFKGKFARMEEFTPPHRNSLIGGLCSLHSIDPFGAVPQVGQDRAT